MEIKPVWWRMGLEYLYGPQSFHSVKIIPSFGPQWPYLVNIIIFIGPQCPYSVNLSPIIGPQCPYSVIIIPIIGPQCPYSVNLKSSSMSCRTLRGFGPGKMTISGNFGTCLFSKSVYFLILNNFSK